MPCTAVAACSRRAPVARRVYQFADPDGTVLEFFGPPAAYRARGRAPWRRELMAMLDAAGYQPLTVHKRAADELLLIAGSAELDRRAHGRSGGASVRSIDESGGLTRLILCQPRALVWTHCAGPKCHTGRRMSSCAAGGSRAVADDQLGREHDVTRLRHDVRARLSNGDG